MALALAPAVAPPSWVRASAIAELEERSVRLAHFPHEAGSRVGDSFAQLSERTARATT
jgi:hypothetical protein